MLISIHFSEVPHRKKKVMHGTRLLGASEEELVLPSDKEEPEDCLPPFPPFLPHLCGS